MDKTHDEEPITKQRDERKNGNIWQTRTARDVFAGMEQCMLKRNMRIYVRPDDELSETVYGNKRSCRTDTVLSGAEERVAEERPGWNFQFV